MSVIVISDVLSASFKYQKEDCKSRRWKIS